MGHKEKIQASMVTNYAPAIESNMAWNKGLQAASRHSQNKHRLLRTEGEGLG